MQQASHNFNAPADPLPRVRACPRCLREFACNAENASPCWCNALRLAPAQRDALAARYRGCLCPDCLASIARGDAPA